jgi:hypothetical protein
VRVRTRATFLTATASALALGEIVFREKVVRPISKRDGRSTPFGVAARPELPNDRWYIIIDGDNLCRGPILFLLTSTNWRQALWLPAPGVRCSRCRSRKG